MVDISDEREMERLQSWKVHLEAPKGGYIKLSMIALYTRCAIREMGRILFDSLKGCRVLLGQRTVH